MMFKNLEKVSRDLTTIFRFPCLKTIQNVFSLPKEISSKICFLAGNKISYTFVKDLSHWHQPELGICFSEKRKFLNADVLNSINVLKTNGHFKDSILLAAYSKVTKFMTKENRVKFRCDDEEWDSLLDRLLREFSPLDEERKLVARKTHHGNIHVYTKDHRYSMDAYSEWSRTWRYLVNLPIALIRFSPENEKPILISKIISSITKFDPNEVHQRHVIGRIAEVECEAFHVYVKTLAKKNMKNANERKVVRQVITAKMVSQHLVKLTKKLSEDDALKASFIRDIYILNPIRNAKFPREVMETLVRHCKGVTGTLIRKTFDFLNLMTGKELKLNAQRLVHLKPRAFEETKKILKGNMRRFSRAETKYLICQNPKLFSHIFETKQDELLDDEIEYLNEYISGALNRELQWAWNDSFSLKKRKIYANRAKLILKFQEKLISGSLTNF